eukprot:TRINITY_DN24555_c0_g1_i1.p1 TRINITY_DN24555_c0_g1~~TRINITY_DN24555_c0_g1_i1.p1  ORF type:complete len:108 (+),score=8.05 TRINITY_DN24555_c0_g1_i1:50-325(+)
MDTKVPQRESFLGYAWRFGASTGVAIGTVFVTRDTQEAKTVACSLSDTLLGDKLSWWNGQPVNPERLDAIWKVRSQAPKNENKGDKNEDKK